MPLLELRLTSIIQLDPYKQIFIKIQKLPFTKWIWKSHLQNVDDLSQCVGCFLPICCWKSSSSSFVLLSMYSSFRMMVCVVRQQTGSWIHAEKITPFGVNNPLESTLNFVYWCNGTVYARSLSHSSTIILTNIGACFQSSHLYKQISYSDRTPFLTGR